jgi:hypothetical protein
MAVVAGSVDGADGVAGTASRSTVTGDADGRGRAIGASGRGSLVRNPKNVATPTATASAAPP